MRVTVKLFASLSQYLPPGAVDNVASVRVTNGATPTEVMRALGLPPEQCHLVLINGAYVAPSERDRRRLGPDDALAIWPPVAGG
jgi:molybdopterin converting factor small subunit